MKYTIYEIGAGWIVIDPKGNVFDNTPMKETEAQQICDDANEKLFSEMMVQVFFNK